ncbi:hypothetical protein GQR58_000423 [Nymphon striatum]|nr:hypothetical protein GQR58_000423 [Nymphon striatum]
MIRSPSRRSSTKRSPEGVAITVPGVKHGTTFSISSNVIVDVGALSSVRPSNGSKGCVASSTGNTSTSIRPSGPDVSITSSPEPPSTLSLPSPPSTVSSPSPASTVSSPSPASMLSSSPSVPVNVPSPLSTTSPFVGSVLNVMVRSSPSGSLSLSRTLIVTGVPAGVVSASSSASGGSLSSTLTITSAVSLRPPSSVIVYEIVSSPVNPSLGVYVIVPSPLSTTSPFGIVTGVPSSVSAVSSSAIGAWFGSVTVMVTRPVSPPLMPSVISYSNVSVPVNPSSGVYVNVPSPLSTTSPFAGSVLNVTDNGSPSGSLSLSRTSIKTGVFKWRAFRIVCRHRRFIRIFDRYSHFCCVRRAGWIAHDIGDCVWSCEIGIRSIIQRPVRVDCHITVGRTRLGHGQRIAIRIAIVVQNSDWRGFAGRNGRIIVFGDGWVVRIGDINHDSGSVAFAIAIGDCVIEHVCPDEVRVRRVCECAIAIVDNITSWTGLCCQSLSVGHRPDRCHYPKR